jgi:hypothetical protein
MQGGTNPLEGVLGESIAANFYRLAGFGNNSQIAAAKSGSDMTGLGTSSTVEYLAVVLLFAFTCGAILWAMKAKN